MDPLTIGLLAAGGYMILKSLGGEDTSSRLAAPTVAKGTAGRCRSGDLLRAAWDGSQLRPPFRGLDYNLTPQPGSDECDCSYFLKKMANEAGCYLPRTASEQFALAKEVSEGEAASTPGALVGLQSKSSGKISHIELGVGDGRRVLACWSGSGSHKAPQPWGWWKGKQTRVSIPRYGVLENYDPAAEIYYGYPADYNLKSGL